VQVWKKGGDLRHWSTRMPVLRSRSLGEKLTCANGPLHLRQCREERIPLRFRGAALAASIMQPSVLRNFHFFRNLIFGEESTLSNREMHVSVQSITPDVSKSQFDTLNCSLEELAVLKAVGENPHITQEALKTIIGKSISTVKRLTINLQKKGLLVRKNGKRDGYWKPT